MTSITVGGRSPERAVAWLTFFDEDDAIKAFRRAYNLYVRVTEYY